MTVLALLRGYVEAKFVKYAYWGQRARSFGIYGAGTCEQARAVEGDVRPEIQREGLPVERTREAWAAR